MVVGVGFDGGGGWLLSEQLWAIARCFQWFTIFNLINVFTFIYKNEFIIVSSPQRENRLV